MEKAFEEAINGDQKTTRQLTNEIIMQETNLPVLEENVLRMLHNHHSANFLFLLTNQNYDAKNSRR